MVPWRDLGGPWEEVGGRRRAPPASNPWDQRIVRAVEQENELWHCKRCGQWHMNNKCVVCRSCGQPRAAPVMPKPMPWVQRTQPQWTPPGVGQRALGQPQQQQQEPKKATQGNGKGKGAAGR
eukprot:8209089-Alexandrium_andersonii.AAC.1